VVLPSYGRDGATTSTRFTATLIDAGYRVCARNPAASPDPPAPMTGVGLGDLGDDIAQVIGKLGHGPAVVLGHAFGNFVARTVATDHPTRSPRSSSPPRPAQRLHPR